MSELEAQAAIEKKTPLRNEIPEGDTWDLSLLYPSDAAWEEAFQTLQQTYPTVQGFVGKIASSATTLAQALDFERSINQQLEKLAQFAALRLSEDSANSDSLKREARLQHTSVQIAEAFSFLSPEIQSISDDTWNQFLADSALAEWQIYLKKLRRFKPHTLSQPEERLLALSSSALAGHHDTFSQLTNVDMKFGTVKNGKGITLELTQSSFSSLLQDRNPAVRRNAFHQFYSEFADHQFTLASALASSVRSDCFYARARNYPSALESGLFADDVPVSVYENLIGTVRNNLTPLFQYFELRKQILKLPEIHQYDTYVPLVSDFEKETTWDEAVDLVLAAVAPLGDEYVSTLAQGLRQGRWCDRYENKGKRSGAFSYGTYFGPPYILMNYKHDVFSDVYTLAHEAGHSMHTWYSKQAQRYQDYHYPIFLAEVASTFNEELLTHHLLQTTKDPKMRAYLLCRQIDDIRGTLFRQTMFAEFEKRIHEVEEAGDALTLDAFKSIYRDLLKTYFGPDFSIDPELDYECLRIPHFYSAFYVYKYATGISAAIALAERVLATGDAPQYLCFLQSGGSKFPIETLADAGVNMASPEPIEAALSLFTKRVQELEVLMKVSSAS